MGPKYLKKWTKQQNISTFIQTNIQVREGQAEKEEIKSVIGHEISLSFTKTAGNLT